MHSVIRSSLAVGTLIVAGACSGADTGSWEGASVGTAQQAAAAAPKSTGGPVDVWHSNSKGKSASASSWDQYGSTYVDVWEDTSAKLRTAYLNIYASRVDPASQKCVTNTYCWPVSPIFPGTGGAGSLDGGGTGGSKGGAFGDGGGSQYCEDVTSCYYTRSFYENGWGEIPSGDLKFGHDSARLRTNLSGNPKFYGTLCMYDSETGNSACSPLTGTIDMTWTANGQYSQSQNGTSTYKSGFYTSRSVGQWDSSSANVTGPLLGYPFTGYGNLSDSKTNTITKYVSKN
jgi:hypothetical protein